MAGYWLKLYTEILDDPKYYRLSDNAKLGMYELMIVAKKVDMDGWLPSLDDICFYTRRSAEWWQPVIDELERIHFVEEDEDGVIIRKFAERQAAVPDDERQRMYRKNRHAKEFNNEETVTNESRNVTERRNREEKEIEKEEEADSAPTSPVSQVNQGDWKSEYSLNKEHYLSFEKDTAILLDNIFLGVTSFYPTKDAPACRRAITLICERKGIPLNASNSEKIKETLKPFFTAWCKRKGVNGNYYSKTNTTWLTEWAVLGEIPAASTGKKEKTVGDVIPQQTQEEKERIKASLRKSSQEKSIPVEIHARVEA